MRTILLLFTLLVFITAQAQIRIGVQGGYNNIKWSETKSTSEYSTSSLDGFLIGIVSEQKISKLFFLRSGLFISGKGTNFRDQNGLFNDTSSRGIWIHYIEAPLTLGIQKSIGNNFNLFACGGLYAAYAIRGVEKGEGKGFGGPYVIYDVVQFSNHNESGQTIPIVINPFDWGYSLSTGIGRNNMQLLISYSHGLKSLFPNSEPYGTNYRNRVISVSISYFLLHKTTKHQ